MVFDDTARMMAVSWVLFEGFSKKEAARRLACNRATVQVWISAYVASGEWWPDPVLRNRHADSVIYDSHFLEAVNAVILTDPEQLIGEIKDVFTHLSTLPGYRDSYKASIGTLDRILRAAGFSYKKLYRMCRERDQERREAFGALCCQFRYGASSQLTRRTRMEATCGAGVVGGCAGCDMTAFRAPKSTSSELPR